MSNTWWETFFDADYLRLWGGIVPPDRAEQEVDGLWKLLGLRAGSRVLDAPCVGGGGEDAGGRLGILAERP